MESKLYIKNVIIYKKIFQFLINLLFVIHYLIYQFFVRIENNDFTINKKRNISIQNLKIYKE